MTTFTTVHVIQEFVNKPSYFAHPGVEFKHGLPLQINDVGEFISRYSKGGGGTIAVTYNFEGRKYGHTVAFWYDIADAKERVVEIVNELNDILNAFKLLSM